jgi:hypothetical protein
MRKLILPLLLAAAATPALAAERSYSVGGFDRVSNSTPFDVYVHTGKAPSAHAAGDDRAIDRLQIEVVGGELRVATKQGSWFGWHWGNQRARIDVTVPAISGANLAGPGNLNIDLVRGRAFTAQLSGPGNINVGAIQAGDIELRLSGPGDISIAGHGGHGTFHVSGPGDIRAAGLTVQNANVSISGPGNVRANVTGSADVTVSGPGDAHLTGGAHCTIHKSFPGDATCS